MIKDIVLVLLIVATSYLFTINDTKNKLFDTQMMFILVSLGLIVLFKVLYYKQLSKKEGFQNLDIADQINMFVEGQKQDRVDTTIDTLSDENKNRYMNSLSDLITQVSTMNQQLGKISGDPTLNTSGGLQNDRLSLESMQKMQNFQIKYLQEQIEKSKELLQQQELEESIKKYKPIKVYSSCAVSSADGTFSEDTPVLNNIGNNPITPQQAQSTASMLQTISQSNGGSTSSVQYPNILGQTLNSLLTGISGPTQLHVN